MRVVVVVARDEDAGAAASQALAREARVVEGLDRHLEQEPLLRVHPLRFAREDAEVVGVEAVDRRRGTRPSLRERACAGAAGSASYQASASQRSGGTSRIASMPVAQEPPEAIGGVVAAGHAAAHAHDGDRVGLQHGLRLGADLLRHRARA